MKGRNFNVLVTTLNKLENGSLIAKYLYQYTNLFALTNW